jgi:hypothetical protein
LQQNARRKSGQDSEDVGGDDEKDSEPVEKECDVWGKQWTQRTAAGHLFKNKVDEEMGRLVETGSYTHMMAYQPALTNIWNGLSEEDQVHCEDEAKRWNTGVWPRERQIEYVENSIILTVSDY